MNIRTKLVLGLFIVLVINLGVGFYAVGLHEEQSRKAAQICALSFRIVGNQPVGAGAFQEAGSGVEERCCSEVTIQFSMTNTSSSFYRQERITDALMDKLIPLISGHPESRRAAEEFLAAHRRLGRAYREALQHYTTDEGMPHIAVDSRVQGIDRHPTDLLDDVVRFTHEYRSGNLAALKSATTRVNTQILILMLSTLIGSILFAIWLIDRNIGQHIAAATRIATKISSGDFSSEIPTQGRDEAAQMLQALKAMQESLEQYRETLRKSEEQTRLLLNSSGQGIYGVDTVGRCTFCNPAAVKMLGYESNKAFLGREIHPIMHHTYPDGRPYSVDDCQASQTYRDGRPAYVDDEVFWRRDGSSFPVEYRSFPIYHDDKLLGAVVNFADVTERKQVESNLKEVHAALAAERAALAERVEKRTEELRIANAELARSARAKDEFLASMSHELRTPLTSILGNSEILIDQFQGPLNEKQIKTLKTIEESANHLLSLINDVLDVAKVEAGKMVLAWDEIPVNLLCEASLRLIKQSADHKSLTVSSQIDPEVGIVPGDSRRLKQMLVNLLSNAVKFTPEGGAIGLEVAGDPSARQARFTVWDTGIGIDEKQQGLLFQPFVQLDSKLSRQYSGTGLGLVLVRRMAELHGGRVSLESWPGEGSRFSILLPWDPSSNVTPAGAKQRPPSKGAGTSVDISQGETIVLLAEDDGAIMTMLSDYLGTQGYTVISAHDGEEAVTKARQGRPDVILMDIQMPGMDGLQAIEHLRRLPGFRKTPIIALTALAMPGDRERCLEAGADDYLAKPVGLKELHHKIQSWVKRL